MLFELVWLQWLQSIPHDTMQEYSGILMVYRLHIPHLTFGQKAVILHSAPVTSHSRCVALNNHDRNTRSPFSYNFNFPSPRSWSS